jgi:PHD/YefM family antitoxin component YafN of YafNO toxin-antitoxin module
MVTHLVAKTHLRDRIRTELDNLGDDTLVVTERGRPLAVLVSVERWNEIQETLEDLEDAVAILEARTAPERGRPAEQVFAAIEAEEADVQRSVRQAG